MDFLYGKTSDGREFEYPIKGRTLKVGRSHRNDLVLKDRHLSRIHAEFENRPDGLYISDLGGKTGIIVNGTRISGSFRLHTGDSIRIGSTHLTLNRPPVSSVEFRDRPFSDQDATTVLPVRDISQSPLPLLPVKEDSDSLARTPTTEASGGSPENPIPVISDRTFGELSVLASRTILEANTELVFHRPLGELLEKLMTLIRKCVPYERGLLMLYKDGKLVPEVVRVPPGEEGRKISLSRTIANHVVRKYESVLTSDALSDSRFQEGDSVQSQHLRSVICVPLWNRRKVIGLIYVDNPFLPEMFGGKDLLFLTHLAIVAAVKIEQQRLFEREMVAKFLEKELQMAAEIQRHLLPSEPPAIPGYLLFGLSLPCLEVGGDYYDYIPLPGGRFGIGLGDVAGKGAQAALLMSSFQASMVALADLDLPLNQTLTRLNRLFYPKVPSNRYVTFFYGVLNPETHSLTYVNAGHNSPCIFRAGEIIASLDPTGPPVGTLEKISYEENTVSLQPGDILLCYSDGVTEGHDPEGEQFGTERLEDTVRRESANPPDEIAHRILDEVKIHHAGSGLTDDLTLVVLKRTG